MLETLATFGDRVEFGEPLALLFVPLAGICLAVGVAVHVFIRRLRPARTHGSSYPLVGPIKLWLVAAWVVALVAIAAAQPRLRYGGASFKRGAVDLAILIDGSASMWVRDLGPSRLEVAVRELMALQTEGILQTGDRVGLFVFGGTTIRKVHLSSKTDRLIEEIAKVKAPETLSGDSFPWDSDVVGAFEHVHRSLDLQDRYEAGASERDWRPARRSDRAVIVVSDGDFQVAQDEMPRMDAALAELRRRGIPVYAIGIGTRTGADLTSILRDYDPNEYDASLAAELTGQTTVLRANALTYLAERTGGKTTTLDNGGQSAAGFLRENVDAHRGLGVQLVPSDDSLEAWQYLVTAAVVLLALAILFY
jgi:hypothetical protein